MPPIDAIAVHGVTWQQWVAYAAFHRRAARVMEALASALERGDRAQYHEAMGEFTALAAEQRGGAKTGATA